MTLDSNGPLPSQQLDAGSLPALGIEGPARQEVTTQTVSLPLANLPCSIDTDQVLFSEDCQEKFWKFFDPSSQAFVKGYLLDNFHKAAAQQVSYNGAPLKKISVSGYKFHFYDLFKESRTIFVVDILKDGDGPKDTDRDPKTGVPMAWIRALIRLTVKILGDSTTSFDLNLEDFQRPVSRASPQCDELRFHVDVGFGLGKSTLLNSLLNSSRLPSLSWLMIDYLGTRSLERTSSYRRIRWFDLHARRYGIKPISVSPLVSRLVGHLDSDSSYSKSAAIGAQMTLSSFSDRGGSLESTSTSIVDFGAPNKRLQPVTRSESILDKACTSNANDADDSNHKPQQVDGVPLATSSTAQGDVGTTDGAQIAAITTPTSTGNWERYAGTVGAGGTVAATFAGVDSALSVNTAALIETDTNIAKSGLGGESLVNLVTDGMLATAEIPREVNVRAIRDKLNMTQEDFAQTFGLSVASLRNWEQGTRTPERPIALYLRLIDRFPEQVKEEVAAARGMH